MNEYEVAKTLVSRSEYRITWHPPHCPLSLIPYPFTLLTRTFAHPSFPHRCSSPHLSPSMTLIRPISGIRGTIGGVPGEGLTPLDTVRYVAAFGVLLKKRSGKSAPRVVLGRDARISGPMVRDLVVGTLVSSGFEVIDLGPATPPPHPAARHAVFAYHTRSSGPGHHAARSRPHGGRPRPVGRHRGGTGGGCGEGGGSWDSHRSGSAASTSAPPKRG